MNRLLEFLLVGVLGASLMLGAYVAGKRVEKQWWRAELARGNAKVAAVIQEFGHEAEGLDDKLIASIGGEHAKLATEEADVERRNRASPLAVSDPNDACRPIPAQCLRRAAGGAAASRIAASRP